MPENDAISNGLGSPLVPPERANVRLSGSPMDTEFLETGITLSNEEISILMPPHLRSLFMDLFHDMVINYKGIIDEVRMDMAKLLAQNANPQEFVDVLADVPVKGGRPSIKEDEFYVPVIEILSSGPVSKSARWGKLAIEMFVRFPNEWATSPMDFRPISIDELRTENIGRQSFFRKRDGAPAPEGTTPVGSPDDAEKPQSISPDEEPVGVIVGLGKSHGGAATGRKAPVRLMEEQFSAQSPASRAAEPEPSQTESMKRQETGKPESPQPPVKQRRVMARVVALSPNASERRKHIPNVPVKSGKLMGAFIVFALAASITMFAAAAAVWLLW